MLEWVCPKCDRAVDPAFQVCPFCGNREVAAPKPPGAARQRTTASRRSWWADMDRGFRFGLSFVAVLVLVYLLVLLAAYIGGNNELIGRLTRWLHWR
jgi:hypothetical protein